MPGLRLSTLARNAVFAPVQPGGRVDAVVQRLSDSIALGMLGDGEQLPAQQDLAADLGVSLVTLREALSQLAQRGLVETRRGHRGGSFVRHNIEAPTDTTAAALDRLYRMSSHELVDLTDMQRAVSGQASRLAAERATPDYLARLTGHVDHLEQAGTAVARRRNDGRFLIEVAATSQSVRLTRAEMRLQAEVNELRWLPDGDAACTLNPAEAVAGHRRLIAAIGAKDAAAAQSEAEARVNADLRRLSALHMRLLGR